MKILHVVPLVTPTGAYGGPVTVALNQARALLDRGHDVQIAGALAGYVSAPTSVGGVPAHLFPAMNVLPGSGFAGLYSAGLRTWFAAAHQSFDAVHFHLSRNLTTLPLVRIARRSGTRYVTQTHGMIDRSGNPLAIALDAVMTRSALRHAAVRFHLTERERADLIELIGREHVLEFLPNGVPDAGGRGADGADPIASATEVLFLARLQRRKRPLAFIEAASRLAPDFPTARFTLIGPDEGEGPPVAAAIHRTAERRIVWEGPIAPDEALDRMAKANIYVLPSVDEPFPMSVLEAMSLGLPVIVSDSNGLADTIRESGSGIVVDQSIDQLEEGLRLLLSQADIRQSMGDAARRTARARFSMPAVARQLEVAYARPSRDEGGPR